MLRTPLSSWDTMVSQDTAGRPRTDLGRPPPPPDVAGCSAYMMGCTLHAPWLRLLTRQSVTGAPALWVGLVGLARAG